MAEIIETRIPKDVRKYKTKIIGPFTLRQAICGTIAITLDIGVITLLGGPENINSEVVKYLVYAFVFLDIPILAFTIDIQGVPMERIVKRFIFYNLLAPTRRVAKKDFRVQKKTSSSSRSKSNKMIKKMLKMHPEYKIYK